MILYPNADLQRWVYDAGIHLDLQQWKNPKPRAAPPTGFALWNLALAKNSEQLHKVEQHFKKN